eukprot:1030628-Prorocentrum_minimum.AAC.1
MGQERVKKGGLKECDVSHYPLGARPRSAGGNHRRGGERGPITGGCEHRGDQQGGVDCADDGGTRRARGGRPRAAQGGRQGGYKPL